MANEVMIPNSGSNDDQWRSTQDGFEGTGPSGVGWISYVTSSNKRMKCAFRFPNVQVARGGCNYAGLYFWTQHNGKSDGYPRSGNWNFRVRGIDEDNTSGFGSGNPFGRTQTDAYDDSNNGDEPDTGTWKEVNVTSSVNEIMSRSGWNQGNAIGLLLDPTEEASNKYASTSSDHKTFLVIRKSAEPNFTPTSKLVVAPTLPAAGNFGMAWAYPGENVFEASEDRLYSTTRKRVQFIIAEGVINATANVLYQIAHGLSYKPQAHAFAKSNTSGERFKLPRYMPTAVQLGPNDDTLQGDIQVTNTHVEIITTQNAEVYYRIFLDQLV